MNVLLIYESLDARKNKWFIEQLIFQGKKNGLNIKLVTVDCADSEVDFEGVDLLINRSRFSLISQKAECQNVPCSNNEKTCLIGNDKYFTYSFCLDNSIPVLNTKILDDVDKVTDFPVVVKTVDGHGGEEVFLVGNKSELKRLKNDFEFRTLIYQRPAKTLGQDCRVYLVGNQVIAAILRTSREDFRSNFSLGGSAQVYDLDEKYIAQARLVAEKLDSDFIGVDFIKDGDRFILNEIEDCVGSRMLYSSTAIDVVKLYIAHLRIKYSKVGQ